MFEINHWALIHPNMRRLQLVVELERLYGKPFVDLNRANLSNG